MATLKKKAKKKTVVKKPANKKKASKATPKLAKVVDTRPKLTALPTNWSKILSPLHDRILIIEHKDSGSESSLLILPDDHNKPTKNCKVVAVGPGRVSKKGKLRPLDVTVGDVVMIQGFSGTKVTFGSQDAWIIREDDVLGILE